MIFITAMNRSPGAMMIGIAPSALPVQFQGGRGAYSACSIWIL
jgi:hypothetical protein